MSFLVGKTGQFPVGFVEILEGSLECKSSDKKSKFSWWEEEDDVSTKPPNTTHDSRSVLFRTSGSNDQVLIERHGKHEQGNSYTSENTRSHDNSLMAYGKTLFPFTAENSNELSFVDNEIVMLLRHIDESWIEGEIDGRKGIFPSSFVDIIVDCPWEDSSVVMTESVSQEVDEDPLVVKTEVMFGEDTYGLVLYDFRGDHYEALVICEGDTVTLISQVDSYWYRAKHDNGLVGLCPVEYVQVLGAEPGAPPGNSTKSDEEAVQVKPVEEKLIVEKSVDMNTVEENQITEAPVEENHVEEKSVAETPVEENHVEEKSVAKTHVEENHVEEKSVAETPVEENHVEEKSVAKTPVEENHVEEKSVAETPVEENHVEEKSVAEMHVEENHVEVKSVAETPVEENHVEEKLVCESHVEDEIVGENRVEVKPVGENKLEKKPVLKESNNNVFNSDTSNKIVLPANINVDAEKIKVSEKPQIKPKPTLKIKPCRPSRAAVTKVDLQKTICHNIYPNKEGGEIMNVNNSSSPVVPNLPAKPAPPLQWRKYNPLLSEVSRSSGDVDIDVVINAQLYLTNPQAERPPPVHRPEMTQGSHSEVDGLFKAPRRTIKPDYEPLRELQVGKSAFYSENIAEVERVIRKETQFSEF